MVSSKPFHCKNFPLDIFKHLGDYLLLCNGFYEFQNYIKMVTFSLQQLSYSTAQLAAASGDCLEQGDEIVALHRRTNVILVRRKLSFVVCHWDGHGIWKARSAWNLPLGHHDDFPSVIACIPIETMDAFLILFGGLSFSYAVFFSLEGLVLNDIQINQRILCADIDQNRKELLMGLSGGRVVSYAIRLHIKKVTTTETVRAGYDYLLILRKYILLSGLDSGSIISRLVISDLSGTCLALMKGGGIIALETSCLEVLWRIPIDRFVYPPVFIWLDKAGTDFLVWCQDSTEGSIERNRKETLEYWTVPATMSECDSSQFSRVTIPVSGQCMSATIESVGAGPSGKELLIATFSRNSRIQLWRGLSGSGTVRLYCDMPLHRSMEEIITSSTSHFFRDGNSSYNLPSVYTRLSGTSTVSFMSPPEDVKHAADLAVLLTICCDIAVVSIHKSPAMSLDAERLLKSVSILRYRHTARSPQKFDISRLPRDQEHGNRTLDHTVPPASPGSSAVCLSAAEVEKFVPDVPALNNIGTGKNDVMDDSLEVPDSARSMASSTSSFSVDIMMKAPNSQSGIHSSARLDLPIINNAKRTELPVEPANVQLEHVHDFVEIPLVVEEVCPPLSPAGDTGLDFYQPILVEDPKLLHFIPLHIIDGLSLPASLLQCITQFGSRQDVHSMYESDCFMTLASPPSSLILTIPDYEPSKWNVQSESTAGDLLVSSKNRQRYTELVSSCSSLKLKSQLKLLTVNGLKELSCIDDALGSPHLGKSLIDCKLFSLAYLIGVLAIVNTMNECFLTCIGSNSETEPCHRQPRPLRLPVDIRSTATTTFLLAADIRMFLPNSADVKKTTPAAAVHSIDTSIESMHSLTLIGDSDGLVHVTIATRSEVISSSQIKAHSAPVVSILSCGDSIRPLWRIGGRLHQIVTPLNDNGHSLKHRGWSNKLKVSKSPFQIHPVAIPGSAIVTLSREGEVKVWQPTFVFDGRSQSTYEHVLSVCKVQWLVSGMYSCASVGRQLDPLLPSLFCSRAGNARIDVPTLSINRVASACLDPTCMTLLVCFGNGRVEQWPLPGIVTSATSSLSTCRKKMWSLQAHKGNISDMRLWVHSPSTVVRDVEAGVVFTDSTGESGRKIIRYASAVHSSSGINTTIAYTSSQMKVLSEVSTLVTSSADKSLLVWKFILTEGPLNLGSDESDTNMYLQLCPCRRFTFSDSPRAGICFSTAKFDSSPLSIWRVTAIVSGVIVNVLEGCRGEIFRVTDSVAAEYVQDVALSGHSGKDSDSYHRIPAPLHEVEPDRQVLQTPIFPMQQDAMLLPSCGHVIKPLRTVDATARATLLSKTLLSDLIWAIYGIWAEKIKSQQVLHDGKHILETVVDPIVDDTSSRRPTRGGSPSADLHFVSPSGAHSRGTLNKSPARSSLPTAITDVGDDNNISSFLLSEELHRFRERIESPRSTKVDQNISSHSSQNNNSGREKVVMNGVRMDVAMNDDDSVHSGASSRKVCVMRYHANNMNVVLCRRKVNGSLPRVLSMHSTNRRSRKFYCPKRMRCGSV
jgi:hypothetical protein